MLLLSFVSTVAAVYAMFFTFAVWQRQRKGDAERRALTITTVSKPPQVALLYISDAQIGVLRHRGHLMIPAYVIDSVHSTQLAAMLRFNEVVNEQQEGSDDEQRQRENA